MSIALDKIKRESEEKLNKGSAEEMSDMIFDTLFQNTHFPQLDMKKMTEINDMGDCQEVNRGKKEITFGYCGHIYRVNVEMIS